VDGRGRSTRSWHGTGDASSGPELAATSTPAQTFEPIGISLVACSIGHLTDDLAERKFSPTPTLRHLADKATSTTRTRATPLDGPEGPAMPGRIVSRGTIG